MSDLAHKLLAALEHAGVGGAAVKDLADEHLPAVDPETGVRPPLKASSSSSSASSKSKSGSRSRSRSSSRKADTSAASSSGGGSQQTSDAG